ncbi:hypothetical protein ACLB2K_052200 [Fragaria x ananassa]
MQGPDHIPQFSATLVVVNDVSFVSQAFLSSKKEAEASAGGSMAPEKYLGYQRQQPKFQVFLVPRLEEERQWHWCRAAGRRRLEEEWRSIGRRLREKELVSERWRWSWWSENEAANLQRWFLAVDGGRERELDLVLGLGRDLRLGNKLGRRHSIQRRRHQFKGGDFIEKEKKLKGKGDNETILLLSL